jgi:DNA-binding winged helix-turn-helix (wHTH) protein
MELQIAIIKNNKVSAEAIESAYNHQFRIKEFADESTLISYFRGAQYVQDHTFICFLYLSELGKKPFLDDFIRFMTDRPDIMIIANFGTDYGFVLEKSEKIIPQIQEFCSSEKFRKNNGEFSFDSKTGLARYKEKQVKFSNSENLIFELLFSKQNEYTNKFEIEECLWGGKEIMSETKTIESYISHIRRKLEKLHPEFGKLIVNRRNFGWKFHLPEI